MKAVKAVYLIALAIGVLVALQVVKKWITTSPYFEVSFLEIVGNERLTLEEITALAHIDAEQNIFTLDLETVRRGLLSHPWVKNVVVKRKMPRTITLNLTERTALAVLEGRPEALLDEEGVVLEVRDRVAGGELPYISGTGANGVKAGQYITEEGTLRALRLVKALSSLSFPGGGELLRVDAGKRGHETIYLKGEEIPIVMGLDSIDDKLERFNAVKTYLHKRNRPIKYMDLTFKGKVIVK